PRVHGPLGPLPDLPHHPDHRFGLELLGHLLSLRHLLRVEHQLDYPLAVAEVHEGQPAVVPLASHPSAHSHLGSDVASPELPARVGAHGGRELRHRRWPTVSPLPLEARSPRHRRSAGGWSPCRRSTLARRGPPHTPRPSDPPSGTVRSAAGPRTAPARAHPPGGTPERAPCLRGRRWGPRSRRRPRTSRPGLRSLRRPARSGCAPGRGQIPPPALGSSPAPRRGRRPGPPRPRLLR